MSENSGFSEENLRKIASQKVSYRVSVKLHVAIFFIVNILLFLVDIFSTPGLYWIIYPFFSWLIGVNMHITGYLLYARGTYPMAKRGVIYHVVSFISVMFFLFIVNFITFPEFYWVVYPSIFWGAAVILHIIIYIQYFSGKVEKSGKYSSRKERAIEKELEKMRKKQEKNN
ncbi:MAG: 2TM domain-containing protein [Promethearchaeota archaeon]